VVAAGRIGLILKRPGIHVTRTSGPGEHVASSGFVRSGL